MSTDRLPTGHGYYVRVADDTYHPTAHTQGAWNDHEQHMAPVGGLLTHVMETFEPRPDLQLARMSLNILGLIPLGPTTVHARIVRPGRTIELVEATATVDGRPVVRGTGWRLARGDSSEVAGESLSEDTDPMPGPDGLPDWEQLHEWPGGYIRSLQGRVARALPGNGRVWLNSDVPLLAGDSATACASFLRLADTANGVAVRARPEQWLFPNVDLTVHLFREPVPGWIGFDTRVSIGDTGIGLTSSTLYDGHGPVGRLEQSLTVRRR